MSDETGRSSGAESGMSPEQYLLIQDLVELASQKPADQREPWLRNALARDVGLLKEALELLQASDALEPEPDARRFATTRSRALPASDRL